MEMEIIYSFEPVINQESRVLILGSMPGVQSLREQKYYAHPYNHFWRIMYALFDDSYGCSNAGVSRMEESSKLPDPDYENRKQFLLDRKIALWDVIRSCSREGSLDTNIVNEQTNDFKNLFIRYPHLELLAFNGAKGFNIYKRKIRLESASIAYLQLPSTSPANTMKFEEKLTHWKAILKYL
ncbi:DNA-deoxyinosine glycosylase [Dehalobacter sp. TBBPA1]|uniref:DNA-deoxyinosine glycosylase n=1 Tax=Dehalobacter sp. TBBPA1 TaxID=3235037 RepID=UPI0034A4CDB4